MPGPPARGRPGGAGGAPGLRLAAVVCFRAVDPLAPEPRRPRPVAGLPAVDGGSVAKSWLIELVAAAPLDDAVGLPIAELAREGPGLADAVVAALSDDNALRRLRSGGNLAWLSARAGTLSGAASAAHVVRAAEALRRATQAALLAEARLDPTTTAELADRLAFVCSAVAEAAAVATAPAVRDPEPAPPDAAPHDPRPEPISPPAGAAGLVALRRAEEEPAPPDAAGVLRARGARRAEAGSWRAAVERRLERHRHDGSPFALLAVEADGLERLREAQTAGEVDELLEALERALASELRPADQLLREEPGRYWVTAPDTGPAVGRLLAERLADGVGSAASHRGAPLTVSIGLATCPEDGQDAERLGGVADQALFAARAAGTPVA